MKQSHVGNLILDYDDQTNLAIIASEVMNKSKDAHVIELAEKFLDYVGDNLEPKED